MLRLMLVEVLLNLLDVPWSSSSFSSSSIGPAGHTNAGLNGATAGGATERERIWTMASVLGRSAGMGWLQARPRRRRRLASP